MPTLQKTIAQIRALECEEIDLICGGTSAFFEQDISHTSSSITYNSNGYSGTITVTDDTDVTEAFFVTD